MKDPFVVTKKEELRFNIDITHQPDKFTPSIAQKFFQEEAEKEIIECNKGNDLCFKTARASFNVLSSKTKAVKQLCAKSIFEEMKNNEVVMFNFETIGGGGLSSAGHAFVIVKIDNQLALIHSSFKDSSLQWWLSENFIEGVDGKFAMWKAWMGKFRFMEINDFIEAFNAFSHNAYGTFTGMVMDSIYCGRTRRKFFDSQFLQDDMISCKSMHIVKGPIDSKFTHPRVKRFL